ncbi:hypothetical protein HHK36_015273 [Tetracentron sinense]|uniref:RRM domain-containing protein n=1 Tax=Tetracentron sinense TaxID=13715 RepID=A0A835DGL7_TETSI|nr:hypothetical protein HHK36_015273 [Tetracentron sinense]
MVAISQSPTRRDISFNMSRKREKPYPSRNVSSSLPKRPRPMPTSKPDSNGDQPNKPTVVVSSLSPSCSVLDLKSRFEIYGSISRLRIDRAGIGYITFRSNDSAEAAIAASQDPSFGITVDSIRVQVCWANDPLPHWREGIRVSSNWDHLSSSKLLRAEVPLSRHGRGNKLGSSTVSPRNGLGLDLPFKGREIVAYDDLL